MSVFKVFNRLIEHLNNRGIFGVKKSFLEEKNGQQECLFTLNCAIFGSENSNTEIKKHTFVNSGYSIVNRREDTNAKATK